MANAVIVCVCGRINGVSRVKKNEKPFVSYVNEPPLYNDVPFGAGEEYLRKIIRVLTNGYVVCWGFWVTGM